VSIETAAARATAGRGRLMATLFAAQMCGSTGHSIGMAVGSIMAAEITGTNTWSGLPVAIGALGTALASWPLARLMDRSGRRPGLVLGYGLAVAGAILGMVGVTIGSFSLLLVGMALFGVSQTSNLLSRYAAADVNPGERRGRAMGLIVWGSTAGSIIGPNLMEPALRVGGLLGVSPAASAFLISVGGYALAAALIEVLLRPDPLTVARELHALAAARGPAEPARPLAAILADVRVQIALATLTISQFVMISTTSTSPVYLHDQGYHVRTIGLAVSLHLGGMYVASPLSGWLCDRVGRLTTIGVGALVLVGAVLLAGLAPGSDRVLVILALALNGVGWNFAFVAGSALLTDALSPAERASTQGLADLAMGLMGALGSTAGGMILGVWGFTALNALGAALVLGPLAATLLRRPVLAAPSTPRS
jgi:MFS family permease